MYWKLAIVQHPMYLLIKEDTECAERTPPWGAPDIGQYIDRLRQNITTLNRYPQIKIGYEWSALELEQLKEDAPDVFTSMLDRVHAGQSTFYNGTYSQPHLQILSSEANYRQFEWGNQVYRKLCPQHPVRVYAHQETSVNEQTPQLLKCFGIPYVTLPHFSSTLLMLDGGELVFHSKMGTMFMHGEEFATWRGLDGSQVELYLDEPVHDRIQDWLAFQEIIGLTHVPPLVVSIPDLTNIDEAWMQERSGTEFVLLENTLEERKKVFPPRFHVRFYTNWSYIEGIRAEELSRLNWKAETSALRAEALNTLAFTLMSRLPESTDTVWKRILTSQHHDVYCFCAPVLRDKSISSLQQAEADASKLSARAALAIAAQVDTSTGSGQHLVVYNTVPHAVSGLVEAELDFPNPAIVDLDSRILPSEAIILPSGKTRVCFLASLPGLGYTTVQVEPGNKKQVEETLQDRFTFDNEFYRALIQPDGSFTSLMLMPSGEELLAGEDFAGNSLVARDSTGLSPKHEGTFDVTNWVEWEPSGRGPLLSWRPTAPAHLRKSTLGTTFTTSGEVGADIKATLGIHFYHALPRIDLDWTFIFDQASIGHFFDDDTKLRVRWPLSFQGDIYHDISFGVVETRDERPFLPASWVDISDGKKGFSFFHQGTFKHWVTGKMLVNLFAWGEDTDAIGNRMAKVRWPKSFDQRLRGTHTIHTAIYPHSGDWRTGDVVGAARSYNMPPVAYATHSHTGKFPAKLDILRLVDTEIASTAVKVEDSRAICRFYSYSQNAKAVVVKTHQLKTERIESLSGEPIDQINPFQIGALTLQPDIP